MTFQWTPAVKGITKFQVRQVKSDVKVDVKMFLNCLGVNPTKWSNTLKQVVGNLPTNCSNLFDHFVGLALEGLIHFNPMFHFYNL